MNGKALFRLKSARESVLADAILKKIGIIAPISRHQ
jgi:hypothetical protein